MQPDSVQDSTRYVVSGRHAGAILPGARNEMRRDVFLLKGAQVEGGIFGRDVSVEGCPVRVQRSVYASGSVTISGESRGAGTQTAVDLMGVVTARRSVVVTDSCRHRVRFLADVFTDQARIHNALIRGNVFARQAILRDCVVLGGVFCSEQLTLENVVVGTFRAQRVTLKPEVIMFYPFAISEQPVDLDFPLKALSFASLRRLLTGRKGGNEGVVFLDQSDVVTLHEPSDGEPRELHMISLGSRILDLEEAKIQFQENQKILELIALGDHVGPGEQSELKAGELSRLESALHRLLTRPPQQEKVPTVPFSALAARPSLRRRLGEAEGAEA